jgi:oleate hydratase
MAKRNPENLDAWILGSGIASLTAAVLLLQEARVPPSRIHIIETLDVASGTTVSHGNAKEGYDFRAGMRPQFNDVCMLNLLSLVPSFTDPNRSVHDEILDFAKTLDLKHTHEQTRFLTRSGNKVHRVQGKKMALSVRDRISIFMLSSKSEKMLGRSRICDFFSKGFFKSSYWLALATTYAIPFLYKGKLTNSWMSLIAGSA